MVEIPENWKRILDFVVKAPVAWQSATAIARALGWGVEETTDVLADMDVAGWVSVWVVEPEPLLTLSTLAAYHYQVVLVEIGPKELPRWSLRGEPAPIPPRAKNVASGEYYARQDKILDPRLSPDLAMEQAETEAERFCQYLSTTCDIEILPPPCHLLGQSFTPWPGPRQSSAAQGCPVCAGRALRPRDYCLYCNRWGLDDVLRKLAAQNEQRHRASDASSPQSTPLGYAAAFPDSSPDAPGRRDGCPQTLPRARNGRAKLKAARELWRTARSARQW